VGRVKIALVHMRHAHTGGTERFLNHIAGYLAERGHEITIVCRSHVEPPHPRVRFVVLRAFAPGSAWRMWAFAKAVEEHIRGSGYDVVFGLGRSWTHHVVRLGGGCHHSLLEQVLPAAPTAWKRLLGRRRLKHQLALKIERRALAPGGYRKVITNSHMVRADVMHRYGIPGHAVSVVYNGVDLQRFHTGLREGVGAELRRELSLSADDCTLLFLGTGYTRKGLDVLIDAFPRLLRQRPGVKLIVVGYDSSRAKFEARARERGLADDIRFLGGRLDPEACFGAADLFVLPTRYDPFANSTIEALACGLPVITTQTNGAHELIEPGIQGEIVPPWDVSALAAQLVEWTDRDRLREASHHARALAERHGIEAKLAATEELRLAASSERLAG
jgi:UDP-glucose:(heptosyl)LPS alpha-1,3-glucosyltransferase